MDSRSRQRLVLPLPKDRVDDLLSDVAGELGWKLERMAPEQLVVREDATRLHCHCSPIEATLSLAASEAGSTEVRIEGRVPGWGPLAGKHAREQTELLARRVGLAAVRVERAATGN